MTHRIPLTLDGDKVIGVGGAHSISPERATELARENTRLNERVSELLRFNNEFEERARNAERKLREAEATIREQNATILLQANRLTA
jgi:hypothetical protein